MGSFPANSMTLPTSLSVPPMIPPTPLMPAPKTVLSVEQPLKQTMDKINKIRIFRRSDMLYYNINADARV